MLKNELSMPNGMTEAIDANNFTSPPPHTFNCHSIKVMRYVIEYEIIEHTMNLTLPVIIVKIRFDRNPKATKI